MKEERRYRGKKRGGGLGAEGICIVAALVIFASLLLMTKANSTWTGESVPDQLYEAVFVTKDWE